MNKHTPQSEFKTPEVTTGALPASRKAYEACLDAIVAIRGAAF